MSRRAALAILVVLSALSDHNVSAHSGLRFSSPLEGATLGDTPLMVQLSLFEKPEVSLSTIHVVDIHGAACETGRPAVVPGDPLSISVRVRPLDTGVYTVHWRVVSAVDGHATSGVYAFGVRTSPAGAAATSTSTTTSRFEIAARGVLLIGLVVLLGAASAEVGRYGGARDVELGASGWLVSVVGLVLLAVAQARNADASFADLVNTAVGQALVWRAVAIAAAGAALVVAYGGRRSTRPSVRHVAMTFVALATLAAIAVHAAAGHAAAGRWHPATTVLIQWAHFAASGIWLGGLAALVLGIRGASSGIKTASVRRFSMIAGVGIVVVAASGIWRAVNELASWDDLTTTAYGRAVLAKAALFVMIAALGALNRWSSVPAADADLRPLRRRARLELALAAGALLAAAMLGTFPPPAAEQVLPGISASGADFATTVRVSLSAASDQPGPNRFVARIVDYDSKKPVQADRVNLQFSPVDDPGVATTSLALAPGPENTYVGSGANLLFDGRWRVTVHIERAASSVEVPLEVEARGVVQPLSIERLPGQVPNFTVLVPRLGYVRFSPDPERPGPSRVIVSCLDVIFEYRTMEVMVVTAVAADGTTRQQPVRRLDRHRFAAEVELRPGRNRITAIARAANGTRMQAAVDLMLPNR